MTLLLSVVGVFVVFVLVTGARRTFPAVWERRVWPAAMSRYQWGAAFRALAYASPGFAYYQGVSDLRLLSDDELCQTWCDSYETVRTARSAHQLELAVDARSSYLDELERRHPLAVEAWLASAATAGGDPIPYLGQGLDDLRQEDR